MQREISYRGQRVDTKEWVYGYLFGIWEKRYILWGTTNDIPNMIEVIPETVGQSTGLYDKNGKEIYEGDILGCFGYKAIVKFGFHTAYNGWYAEIEEGMICELNQTFEMAEVIGNIYENPDYLNEPQEGE